MSTIHALPLSHDWALTALQGLRQALPGSFHVPGLEGLMRHQPGKMLHVMPELFVQIAGINQIAFPSETLTLKPGEGCLIPRGMPHSETFTPVAGDFRMLVIMFASDRIDFHCCVCHQRNDSHEALHGRAHTPEAGRIAALLDDVPLLRNRSDGWSQNAATGLIRAAMNWLGSLMSRPSVHLPPQNPRVFRALRLIAGHVDDPSLSTAMLARRIGCHPAYLSTLFRREMGLPLMDYLHRERLHKAGYLLTHSSMRIKEIAFACGFGGPDYFTRRFRRANGMTPRQFRQRHAPSLPTHPGAFQRV